jgi:hypothetical protein
MVNHIGGIIRIKYFDHIILYKYYLTLAKHNSFITGSNVFHLINNKQATGKLPLAAASRVHPFCNLQRGQSRKDNPDTIPTLDTQDIGRRQTENKNTTQHTKFKRRVTRSSCAIQI